MSQSPEPKKITDFAFSVGWLYKEGKLVGSKLLICGQEYEAWLHDSYIFDAIHIAARWPSTQVTYDRICHLRYWIRENIQHCHNLPYNRIRSMASAKKFISKVIDREYGNMPEWREAFGQQHSHNNEIFQRDEHSPNKN